MDGVILAMVQVRISDKADDDNDGGIVATMGVEMVDEREEKSSIDGIKEEYDYVVLAIEHF